MAWTFTLNINLKNKQKKWAAEKNAESACFLFKKNTRKSKNAKSLIKVTQFKQSS